MKRIFNVVKQFAYDHRLLFVVPLQLLLVVAAFVLSYLVRFDLDVPTRFMKPFWQLLPALIVIKLCVFWITGLLRGWWRYVCLADLIQLFKGNLLASVVVLLYAVFVHHLVLIPRSVLVLDGFFCFVLMGGVRFATRAVRENYLPLFCRCKTGRRLLIVGAGQNGQAIVRDFRTNQINDMNLIGYVDDDPRKKGQSFYGLSVLGTQEELPGLVAQYRIDEIVIAIPTATGQQVQAIVRRCRAVHVEYKILPSVGEFLNGDVSIQQIRKVDLNDLLGRKPISLDEKMIRLYLQGKRVLVTGAGGSIGSEICRQVARFNPAKLILFDNAETPLFLIEQELAKSYPDLTLVPIIGDIRNSARIDAIFDEQLPQVVFHAAAYKHVPMMENNPAEAVNNNVRGTKLLADAADHFRVETFVMVSTDKAVRPTNVMGASKRAAELCVQSLAQRSRTCFVTTRFGNVLGSNGSVIPTFKEQIRNGGPVTVTHPEVSRYFMTIPEATQLVLQAGSMGQGGEIYLFDMGQPVKIVDLAEELIRLSGLQPYEDIEIVYTGLRPGEKLYEELLLAQEGVLPTHHEKICIASSSAPAKETLDSQLEKLFYAANALDLVDVKTQLRVIVPEYQPVEHRTLAKVTLAKVIPHPATLAG
jgi:FlaA1/EpsC-like NDP-sugar epimerase